MTKHYITELQNWILVTKYKKKRIMTTQIYIYLCEREAWGTCTALAR